MGLMNKQKNYVVEGYRLAKYTSKRERENDLIPHHGQQTQENPTICIKQREK